MKSIIFSLFLLLFWGKIAAQDAYHSAVLSQMQINFGLPTGSWVLPNTEAATFSGSLEYGATVTDLTITGQPFSTARSFAAVQGAYPYESGHFYKNQTAIAIGDKCLLIIWLRSPTSGSRINIFAENGVTYDKEMFANVKLSSEWHQFLLPFESKAAYAANKMNFGLHLAALTQTVEVGGAVVLNFANAVSLGQLPVDLDNEYYDGIEANAPWRAAAAASIEQIRKANINISVQDLAGNPLPNAVVKVEMNAHEFGFGSAVTSHRFNGGTAQNTIYEQKMQDLDGKGHGFNENVFENDLKWDGWEDNWFSSQAEIAGDIAWMESKNMRVRGHNLVWPGWSVMPFDMEDNQTDLPYLKSRINAHLTDILTYPGVGNKIVDWDVLNEITGNQDLANAFKGSPGYPTGREIYADIFKKADSLAPAAKLYLNDYVAIENGDNDGGQIAVWKNFIQELVDKNAPVDGIGFQGHFSAFPTGIPKVQAIYDDFYQTFGLEAKITEYDIDKFVPAQTQANYLRDLLTITFAHPSMKGFLMWGFWDGASWIDNAPIFSTDWSVKPSGQQFIDLVFNKWWTDTSVAVTNAGLANVRGFRGKYTISATCGTTVQSQQITLDGDKNLTFNMACTVGTEAAAATDWSIVLVENLVKNALEISWKNALLKDKMNFLIHDISGKLCANTQISAADLDGNLRIEVAQFASGSYFLTAEYGGKKIVKKFVVRD